MRKVVKAAMNVNEDTILDLLDEAVKIIEKECELRDKDEYPDDMKWGKDRFEVPIYVFDGSLNGGHEVDKFTFIFDPENETYDAEEQLHVQLDEFIQEWNRDLEDDEITGDEYVEEAINDITYSMMEKYYGKKTSDQIARFVKNALKKSPYNFVEDEDFTMDDIMKVVNEDWSFLGN